MAIAAQWQHLQLHGNVMAAQKIQALLDSQREGHCEYWLVRDLRGADSLLIPPVIATRKVLHYLNCP